MANPNHIDVKAPKLTKTQKKIVSDFLTQKTSARITAQKLGGSPTKVYCLMNTIIRHAATNGHIDIEKLLKNY